MNPLKARYVQRPVEQLALPPGREVEVELGCAEAQFLFEREQVRPDVVGIGLEIREDLVEEVNAKAAALGSSVRVLFCHANEDFAQLFAPASLDRVFVNFPDPWFKKKHVKRRVMDDELIADVTTALRPGGELFFQSDVWHLALDALSTMEGEPRLRNTSGPWSFLKTGNPYGVRSRREEGCQDEGLPVWRLLYRRDA